MNRLFALSLLIVSFLHPALSQTGLPVVRATSVTSSLREGAVFKRDNWTITPAARPDIWGVEVQPGKTVNCVLITDIDSISHQLHEGETFDFVVLLNGKDSAFTRLQATKPAANFSEAYKKKYDGKVVVEIPEVYELLNILIAITPIATPDSDLVEHETAYYSEVRKWFDPFVKEEAVQLCNEAMNTSFWMYFRLKMDAYSFEFRDGKLVKKEMYDHTSWETFNNLDNYIPVIEAFAQKSNFRTFYANHKAFYDSQVKYIQDSLDFPGMQNWLKRNFPTSDYNCYKVIFSPLVASSQSANHVESNGFKEAHMHVNFPYPIESDKTLSPAARRIRESSILFTELNHNFINPEQEKYAGTEDFQKAFSKLSFWLKTGTSAEQGYNNPASCFNEFMNWGLVSLLYVDNTSGAEQDTCLRRVERMMEKSRGFSHFAAFNQMLVNAYKNRKPEQTVADLYPQIIAWFRDYAAAHE